jgi:ribonucleotide reductase beta subunit family protein with ferritin-like domain
MSSELLTLYPIKHKEIFDLYKRATACFWLAEEIDITEDKKHWSKLTEKEKDFIKNILAFFAASDGVVIENLAKRFFEDIQNSEGRNFYAFQMAMEAVHSEVYSLLIDTYIKNRDEKIHLLQAIETIPVVKLKADWAMKWTNDKTSSFAQRMIAFAIVEGIFFSGAFCSIYWLKDRGLMPGLSLSNDLISRDEGLHMEHACAQYKLIKNKLSKNMVYNMVKEAVDIENKFIEYILKFNLQGMNAKLMKQYIKYIADRLLTMLNYEKLYNEENPFDFMEKITLDLKTNFFEGRNGQYQRSGILSKYNESQNISNDNELLNYEKNDLIKLLKEFSKEENINIEEWLENYEKNNLENIHKNQKLELNEDF